MRRSPGAPDSVPGSRLLLQAAAAARAFLPLAAARAPVPIGAAARAFLPLGAAAVAIVLLLPAAAVDRTPLAVPLGLGLLLALSIARPALGLVVAAVLIPLSWWITRTADLEPLRLAEALVLAVLAGTCLRLPFRPRAGAVGPALPAGVGPAAAAVVAVAAASVVVDLAPAQAGLAGAWRLVTDAARQLSTDYLYGTAAVAPGLADAARLAEGVGLLLVVVAWSRRDAGLPRRLAGASLAGAAAAATVNLSVGANAILATEEPARMLLRELAGGRLTLHAGMANLRVTGEHFLMATCVGVGLAAGRRRAWLYGAATLATGVTVWIVGSHAQLGVAALTALAAGTLWLLNRRLTARWRRAVIGGAVIAAVLAPAVIVRVYSQRTGVFERVAAGDGALAGGLYATTAQHVRLRIEFAETGLRIWATSPLFGVGAGRYHGLSARFMSPWLLGFYPHGENAHNNYLQIAAELGAAGLAAFLGLLAAIAWSLWRALRAGPRLDVLLAGSAAGTAAFLAASVTGHPLLLGETAYPFWIVAGVALAIAGRRCPRPTGAAAGWTLVPLLVLLITLPGRIDAAAQAALRDTARTGLDGIAGAHGLEREPSGGRPYRWTGPRAAFFAPGDALEARIPLRSGSPRRVAVDVAIDGQRVMRVPLFGPDWVDVAVPLAGPRATRARWRIDLLVDPPWPPRERRNGDPRTLGVMLGTIAFPTGAR